MIKDGMENKTLCEKRVPQRQVPCNPIRTSAHLRHNECKPERQ